MGIFRLAAGAYAVMYTDDAAAGRTGPFFRFHAEECVHAVFTDEVKVEKLDNDSVSISIPITQSRYETDDYRAYVSGYNARLDSIFVTSRQTVVRIRDPAKKKRFSIGIQAGYGMTPKGFQPYLGLGVSVNLFNF